MSDDIAGDKIDALALLRKLFEKEKQRSEDADFTICKRLANKLGSWSPTHVYNVLFRGDTFSKRFEKAVVRASRNRHDKPRLYVPADTKDQIAYINKHLTPQDKLEALLIAAYQEDL